VIDDLQDNAKSCDLVASKSKPRSNRLKKERDGVIAKPREIQNEGSKIKRANGID
jgi:hypothetical protein